MNNMDGRERQLAIAESVRRDGRVQVKALAEVFRCSEMTVRRDLEALEATGLLRRVHGGAVRLFLGAEDTPFELRALERTEAKRAVAAAVAGLLIDGETVVLDGGTTAVEIARAVRDRRLTVMPLALRPLTELLDLEQVQVLVPGGEVRPGEHSFTGSLAEAAFEHLRFDTCVLSSCGVDVRQGVTDNLLSEVAVKRAAAASAQRIILAVDSSKLGKVAFGHICPVTAIDVLVTDSSASPQAVQELRDADIDVRIA
ncbi:MAG TPA: DeoR/GlpR family DNA-binding transcription regulator [Streptosporangiaceae bacterium]|nr:DeoR/GlpR family DNA-binding transcription regulator [Streptosporangiaceae bacterium]